MSQQTILALLRLRPLLCGALACLPLSGARAQGKAAGGTVPAVKTPAALSDAETAARLKMPIRLQLGAASVQQVMETLSEQTGLVITAAEYLREREVTMQMEGVTARVALDALAQLYDWKWYDLGAGHLRLAHATRQPPRSLAQFAPAFAACLPKDIRTFVFIGQSAEAVKQQLDLKRMGMTDASPDMALSRGISSHLTVLLQEQMIGLVKPLHIDAAHLPTIAFGQLTDIQQRAILLYPLAQALRDMPSYHLSNRPPPYQRDPAQAVIELTGGNLLIGTHYMQGKNDRYEGFGQPLKTSP